MNGTLETVMLNLTGLARYRGRGGHFSYILHRVTGLGTLLFLAIHILDTSTVYFFPSLYNHAIAIYRSTPFMLGEIALVFCIIFHGVNGLRIAYLDLFRPDLWGNIDLQRKSATWGFLIAVVLWLPALFLMGRALLVYNFGFGA